ncbi:MAG: SpoIIE family protein phosphatase [Bacteroidota bacterium]
MLKIRLKISPRQIRIGYTAAALLAVAVCSLNFYLQMFVYRVGNDQCRWTDHGPSRILITNLAEEGVTEQAGLEEGDVLIRINGKTFANGDSAQAVIDRLAGSSAVYTIERNGVQLEKKVFILRFLNFAFLAQFLFGAGFLLVGYIVVMVKPEGKMQRMFGLFSILSLLFFGLSTANLSPQSTVAWQHAILMVSFVLASVFAPPTFVRFFLLFPVKRPLFESRLFTGLLYGISIILTGLIFAKDGVWIWVVVVAIFSRYIFFIAGLTLFLIGYFRLIDPKHRSELRPLLFGVAVGLAAFVYTFVMMAIDPFLPFNQPLVLLPTTVLVIIPVFFGYAIFRYGLMDVDLVVRRSLVYGAVTATLATLYLTLVYGAGNLLSWYYSIQENRIFEVLSLIAIVIAFDPLKRRFQNMIDRIFYRERYDYQKAMLEFTQELPRLMELDHISHSLLDRISSTMHIDRVAVMICNDRDGCAHVAKNIEDCDCFYSDHEKSFMHLLRKMRKPVLIQPLADEEGTFRIDEKERQQLLRSGTVLSVPMMLKDRLVGFINVGPKHSGNVYAKEDIDLLSTVAGQAAIGIENARLHKSEIEQQRMKEELDVARTIQQGLFPKKNPEIPGFDIAGISLPALSVGGDYYDFIQISSTKLLTVVADVSGKGMSAALYMSKIQGMVQLASAMYRSPKEMLIHINRKVFEGIDRKSFITMILVMYDLKKKEIRICRAGHNRAVLGVNGRFRFLQGGGIGLGLESGKKFESAIEEVRLPLRPNSILVLYTDGITEAMNDRKQQFGEEKLLSILKKEGQRSAREIEQRLLDAVARHRGPAEQHDDITMIIVKTGTSVVH